MLIDDYISNLPSTPTARKAALLLMLWNFQQRWGKGPRVFCDIAAFEFAIRAYNGHGEAQAVAEALYCRLACVDPQIAHKRLKTPFAEALGFLFAAEIMLGKPSMRAYFERMGV